MDYTPRKFEDVVIENFDGKEVAVLRNAVLVEDIELVAKYAKDNNIPFYLGIKTNADGTETKYVLDDGGKPLVVEDGVLGVNVDFVAPLPKLDVTQDLDLPTDVVADETAKQDDEPTETETTEVVTTEEEKTADEGQNDGETTETETKLDVNLEEITRLTSLLQEKDEEISKLTDEIETFKLNQVSEVEVPAVIELDDIRKFLKEHGIKSITID